MKIPSSQHSRHNGAENNTMTPMIDVVFLLLIFFVCAATGQVRESKLSTQMKAGAVEVADPEIAPAWQTEIWIRLAPATNAAQANSKQANPSQIFLNDQPMTDFPTLGKQLIALAEVSKENPIILDIADSVPLNDVVRTLDLCRAGKFESINFALAVE